MRCSVLHAREQRALVERYLCGQVVREGIQPGRMLLHETVAVPERQFIFAP
jgi:hypothetical protein